MNPKRNPISRPLGRWLATVLVAGAAALAGPVLAQPMDGPGMGAMHGGPARIGEGRGPIELFSPRVLDAVGATPEQRAQIRQILQSARQDLRGQREARQALRQEALRAFSQPNIDANAVEALRQKQLAQHELVSRRMTQAMLDASRVLTPQQRQQIAERAERGRQMLERHRRERQSLDAPKT